MIKTFISRNIIQSCKISSHNIFQLFIPLYLALHWFIFIKKSSSPFCPSIYSLLDTVFHSALMQIKLFCIDVLLYLQINVISGKTTVHQAPIRECCSGDSSRLQPLVLTPGIEEGFQDCAELKNEAGSTQNNSSSFDCRKRN